MRTIPLTKGLEAIVDDDLYDWLSTMKWCVRKPFRSNTNYAATSLWDKENKRQIHITMHRLIMNAKKGQEIDHINGNGLDNRMSNLQFVNHSENIRKAVRSPGKSGYLGVYINNNRYIAGFYHNKKFIYVGCYKTAKEAAIACDKKKIEMGLGHRLNFTL